MSKEEQVEKLMTKCVELQAKLDKPITEHPDVQRLVGQVAELQINSHNLQDERDNWVRSFEKLGTENIQLQAENERLIQENKKLKMLLYASE